MNLKLAGILSVVLASSNAPAFAHHSFAIFDMTKSVEIRGQVKDFEWTNPHAWLQLMVPNDKGEPAEWSLELGSPNMLSRSGIKKNTFQPGDKVTVELHPKRDGSDGGTMYAVTFPDGKTITFSAGGNIAQTAAQ